jgi:hypothetical protein
MEALTCTVISLPVFVLATALFLAGNVACAMQFDRLEERGSGRKVRQFFAARGSGRNPIHSIFDRLEERGSGRNLLQSVLA